MQGKSDALPVGSQLQGGKYVIEMVLGQGSFGITYRAANTGSLLHKQVAIKELFVEGSLRVAGHVQHPAERSDESWGRLTANFEREAQTLGRLKHPNIVTVYDAFAENGTIYIVMEFVDGVSLDQLVRQSGGKLPEDEALRYVGEIADALSVLHRNGVLHRDIKPANIMIDKSGQALLIDFGTARDFVADKTLTHSVILTPAFAPPEQFQPRARRGPFTDIYALAATTYWLLTSEPPAIGDAEAVKEDQRLSLSIRTALAHALVFNSAERTQDVASFMRELLGPSAQPAVPLPAPEATTSVSGYERNAAPDATTSVSGFERQPIAEATTIPNQPQPATRWGAETYDESRSNQPPPFTASELMSRPLIAEPPRRPWLAIGGGVAAVVLLGLLALLLLGGKGNGTNTAGGAANTPTMGPLAGITQTAVVVALAQATDTPVPPTSIPTNTPTDTPVPPTTTPVPTATHVPLPLDNIILTSVDMITSNEGWAAGIEYHYEFVSGSGQGPYTQLVVLHYHAGQWQRVVISADKLSGGFNYSGFIALSMTSANEGWLVGDAPSTTSNNGLIFHYNQNQWMILGSITYPELNSIDMVSPFEGWAVGDGILHYSGGDWTEVSKFNTYFNSIAMASADKGWAVGNSGVIVQCNAGNWTQVSSPTSADLYSIVMVSANEGWAVGSIGTILHYSEGEWTKSFSSNERSVNAVAMASSREGWAVGDNGTILHYSGGQWIPENTAFSRTLHSISMTSPCEGWAVGDGIILHYQNGVWSKYH